MKRQRASQAQRAGSRRGAALVIVLSALVLVSLLVVAFFSSVSKELQASQSYATGVSAKLYADAAVDLVISQLRAGTGYDDSSKTWVSQPGLIRQFDSSGEQTQVYKLYSSNQMVAPGTFSPAAAGGETPNDTPTWSSTDAEAELPWNKEPGVYTDLNRPAVVNNQVKYPILNPGGLQAATKIEGFELADGYGIADREDWDGDGDTAEIAQVPMPVRWLYILQDGRFATSTASGSKTVQLTLADGSSPAKENPPVARVAFWTDDDTSRLNVNTASEGDFWTTPFAVGADDDLATGQVNVREYQRYPGHPATTSLSPALNFLSTDERDVRNFIFGMAPRVSGRGSQFGSRMIGFGMPVTVDNDRLYASIDELLFLPGWDSGSKARYSTSTSNLLSLKRDQLDYIFTGSTAKNMAGKPYEFATEFELDPERLELLRFFLTTNSRSPEVNLFGQPRISLWPVDIRQDHQSLQDQLLAFTTTAKGDKYYFQRQDPKSQTTDINLARNGELLNMLKHNMEREIPGFGGSFEGKYNSADMAALRVNLFDWVRTVNIAYRDKAGEVEPYSWEQNTASNGTIRAEGLPGSGQVLPSKLGGVQGVGRFPMLSKGAFSIIRESETPAEDNSKITFSFRVAFYMETFVPMLGYAALIPDYQIEVSGLNGLQLTSSNSAFNNIPVTIHDGTIKVNTAPNFEVYNGRAWGGTQGFDNLFVYSNMGSGGTLTARTMGSTDSESGYPFVSDPITVEMVGGRAQRYNFKLGLTIPNNVVVRIKDPAGNVITEYTLPFPTFSGVTIYNPAKKSDGSDGALPTAITLQDRVNTMVTNFSLAPGQMTGGNTYEPVMTKNSMRTEDLVRGMELNHGDLRLLAMQGTNSKNSFIPHNEYTNTGKSQAHNLLKVGGSAYGIQQGKNGQAAFMPNRGYFVYMAPSPSEVLARVETGSALHFMPQASSWGNGLADLNSKLTLPVPIVEKDFTTGFGSESDGPHIIKADEGNSSTVGMGWGPSQALPYQSQLFPWDDKLSDAFSPNRQVTSAVQLGTLPVQANTGTPWRTLLFRPDYDGSHRGDDSPADYLMLDMFWMPVVDPYPISEALSTAGKVNMNYQVAPFTYIDRGTSVLGALKATDVMAFPVEQAHKYKLSSLTPSDDKPSFVYKLDTEKTLMFFKERFAKSNANENIFRSAAEICNIPLAPKQNKLSAVATGHPDDVPAADYAGTRSANIHGANDAATLRSRINEFWDLNKLTGDNVRELPYNALYPRLTTQSNSYTVYVRVQTLAKAASSPAGTFSDTRDRVTGEYRGSQTVLRYIDPDDTRIPDFAASNSTATLYPYYKFEVKGAKQFIP